MAPASNTHSRGSEIFERAKREIVLAARRRAPDLNFANRGLTELPAEIGQCTALIYLDLTGNRLEHLPAEIGRCSALETVLLSGNRLTRLPAELGQCEELMALFLRDNRLSKIPPELGHCRRLRILEVSENQLTELPAEIGGGDLRTLELRRNLLRSLPSEIGQCRLLDTLDLSENQLTELPEGLRGCEKLRALFLHGNPALGLPPDVLGPTLEEVRNSRRLLPNPKAILQYYLERRFGESCPLDEVKMILVGRGGSGKTSLVERLVWERFTLGKSETLGVQLCDWWMKDCDAGVVRAHVWDFAGQTITHAMHQFFLSVRTVYILVLTGRENSEREDAEYWLRLIAAYGSEGVSGPPVIVVLNKWDDTGSARPKVDRRALHERYPFIVDFVETDCQTNTGISRLRTLLCKTVDQLDWVRMAFPAKYRNVKSKLEGVANSHLPYEDYRKICEGSGIEKLDEQDGLAEILHALGVALNFRQDERLRFASVLKPQWLTEHVYALVRHAEEKSGVLHRASLPVVLADEGDAQMRRFLVEMMVRFEIAYPLAAEGEAPGAWLVPQALPDSQPEGVELFSAELEVTRLRYRYRALPVSIVPRFIVRTHPFIEGEMRWASGVVLALNGARALVRADYVEKVVEITVTGATEARRDLAGLAQREFRFINGQIRGLDPLEETEAAGQWVRVRTLEQDERNGKQTGVQTDEGTVEANPTKELNEFSAPEARDENAWKPRVFISYSHADEAYRKLLELQLEILVNHGVVHEKWDDRKIQPGERWDDSIKRELKEADVVLLLVSAKMLASKYIQTVEMKVALERENAGECVVVPILLEDCLWNLVELTKLQALPRDAKPIRDWTPQLKGWKNVADGLMALFKRLKEKRNTRGKYGF